MRPIKLPSHARAARELPARQAWGTGARVVDGEEAGRPGVLNVGITAQGVRNSFTFACGKRGGSNVPAPHTAGHADKMAILLCETVRRRRRTRHFRAGTGGRNNRRVRGRQRGRGLLLSAEEGVSGGSQDGREQGGEDDRDLHCDRSSNSCSKRIGAYSNDDRICAARDAVCVSGGRGEGRSRCSQGVKLLYPGRSVETNARLTSTLHGEVTFPSPAARAFHRMIDCSSPRRALRLHRG